MNTGYARRWTARGSVYRGLCALVLLMLLAPAVASAQPMYPEYRERPLVVPADEVVRGDLATVEQPIVVAGRVEGDVTSWTGRIVVRGAVQGDVVSYAGAVEVAPGARISGSVLAMAGKLAVSQTAAVAGHRLGEEPMAGGVMVASVATIFGRPTSPAAADLSRPLISSALVALALLLCCVGAALWPLRTRGAALALRQAPAASIGVGLLTTALAGLLLLPLAALLALSLVGLPLLLPLLLLLQVPYLLGIVALGRACVEGVGGQALAAPVAAALGGVVLLLPLAFVGMVDPLASAGLFYLVASVGLGAVILSRGGAHAV